MREIFKVLSILAVVWIAFMFLFLLTGCASDAVQVPSDVTPVVYKYDLFGTVNGVPFSGVGIVPAAKSYTMNIQSSVDVDLLTITSCHRNFSVESAIKLGWFQSKRGYTYVYTPTLGIEDTGSCLVRLGAYNQAKGQNAWGIIDFQTPQEVLAAKVYCDGASANSGGVSICQTKAGLIEKIVFDVPVQTAVNSIDPKCKFPIPKDGMTWEYTAALGECVVAFMETPSPHRIHRHTTIGYDQVQIRGAQ